MTNLGAVLDPLAVERTRLANERTLLAYIRTALAFGAGGMVLLQFFPQYPSLLSFAWALLVAGAVTLAFGAYRFISIERRLRRPGVAAAPPDEEDDEG